MRYCLLSISFLLPLFCFSRTSASADTAKVASTMKQLVHCMKEDDPNCVKGLFSPLEVWIEDLKQAMDKEQLELLEELTKSGELQKKFCGLLADEYMNIIEEGNQAGITWQNIMHVETRIISSKEKPQAGLKILPITHTAETVLRDNLLGKNYIMTSSFDFLSNQYRGFSIEGIEEQIHNSEENDITEAEIGVEVIEMNDESERNTSYSTEVFSGSIDGEYTILTIDYRIEHGLKFTEEIYFYHVPQKDTTVLLNVTGASDNYSTFYDNEGKVTWKFIFHEEREIVGVLFKEDCNLRKLYLRKVE